MEAVQRVVQLEEALDRLEVLNSSCNALKPSCSGFAHISSSQPRAIFWFGCV